MNALPKISVVITTRNRVNYLKRMLDNLLLDEYPNREIIIVDGASTDGTAALLKSYGDKITRWFSEPDKGEYDGYNKGLCIANGEIIKWMTDDDVLRPGSLCLAAEYFDAHPDVDIMFGMADFWKEVDGQPILVKEYIKNIVPIRLGLRDWLRGEAVVYSPASFIRKRVFDKIGFFSAEYSCIDTEFFIRAATFGIKMGTIPQVILDYHLTGQNGYYKKRWRLIFDYIRVVVRYGGFNDLMYVIMVQVRMLIVGGVRRGIRVMRTVAGR